MQETTVYQFKLPFPTVHRHIITAPSISGDTLLDILKRYLNPSVVNGLFTWESIMGKIQSIYSLHFSKYKIRCTQTQAEDLVASSKQEEESLKVHKTAHRNAKENKFQLLEKYYFPKISDTLNKIIKQFKVCKEGKYDRHSNNPNISPTPNIPQYAVEILHIDHWKTFNTNCNRQAYKICTCNSNRF